jgi:Dehydrogenases (flavoproteins)
MEKIAMNADVVVVGGGMAGIGAAVAAARNGAEVLLTEAAGCFGGTATASIMGELNAYTHHGQKIYGGVTADVIGGMLAAGFARLHTDVPMTGDPSVLVDRVRYEPELLKIFFDELLLKENVKFLLHSTFTGIEEAGAATHKISLTNGFHSIEVQSPIVIDATGNADVVHKANGPTWKPGKQEAQAVSLIFRMSGIDAAAYRAAPVGDLRKLILAGNEQGFLPAKYCAVTLIDGTADAAVNMTRISEVDHESMVDMTKAEIEGRRQIARAVSYLKKHWPGFGQAHLSGIAPVLGVREARRIVGRYMLTREDILAGKKFADAVAIGCYPIDIHGKKNHAVAFTPIGGDGIYTIPFSSMLPVEMPGVIAAGKCVAADTGAFAAIRTMPVCLAMGEAAGTAAAIALKKGVPPSAVPVSEIQRPLKAAGHLLP